MKTINKIMILFLIIGFVQTGNIEAQSWKDLKNKAKKLKVKKKTTTTTTSNNNNSNSSKNLQQQRQNRQTTTTTNSSNNKKQVNKPKLPSDEEAARIWAKVQTLTNVSKNWPYEVHKNSFSEGHVIAIEDSKDFKKVLGALWKKYPVLLLFYGRKEETPKGMTYGYFNNDGLPSKCRWINSAITKHIIWQNKINSTAKIQNNLCMVVQDAIVQAEQAQESQKVTKALYALRAAKAVKFILPPENAMIDDLVKNSERTLNQSFSSISHLITGKMHKLHFGKLVGYNEKPIIGKENPASLTNVIEPGKPFYFVGYFTGKLKDLDVKVRYKGTKITGPPALRWSMDNGNSYGNQPLYWNSGEMLNKVKEKTYYVFNLFPEIDKIDFKSHLEYIPTLNLVKWLTYQMPGNHTVKFNFGDRARAGDGIAAGEFVIKLTKENITELKEYYKKLMSKKLAAVKFNKEFGCTNKSTAQLGGLEDMKKHGEIIRFTISQTGKVMKPWPNEHIINNYTGAGWGVFKQADGRYEILSLGFSRAPSSQLWKFTSVNRSKDYMLQGSPSVYPEIINHGFEILKENINTCENW